MVAPDCHCLAHRTFAYWLILGPVLIATFPCCVQELVYFDVAMSVVVACSLACIVSTMAEQRLHGFVSIRTSTFSLLLTVAFITEVPVWCVSYVSSPATRCVTVADHGQAVCVWA
jgi:hypothetical protein